MKRLFLLPLAIVLARIALSDDAVPKRPDFSRYQPMLKRSPFAVATAAAVPVATPDFAKDLYLANAARLPDGDEMVTIASAADKNFKKYPTRIHPDDGWGLMSVEWSDQPGATKATVTKDGKYATLNFNQTLLAQPMPQPVPQPAQQQISAPNMPQNPATSRFVHPPNYPVPPPANPRLDQTRRVRPMIPRNPAVQPTPRTTFVPPASET